MSSAVDNNLAQLLKKGTTYKTSNLEQYRTRLDNCNYFGKKARAAAPVPVAWFKDTGETTSGFKAYKFESSDFVNDCGQFAQSLVQKHAGLPLGELLVAQINGVRSSVKFSVEDPSSWNNWTSGSLANNPGFTLDEAANPGIGQAFTTVPKAAFVGMDCNYHVAAVVAKDGADCITCEADAGDVGRTEPVFDMYEPVFDMYETQPDSKVTFHTVYKEAYGGKLAATGILMP